MKNKKYNPPITLFDTTKKYLIPMLPIGAERKYENESPKVCTITQDKKYGTVRVVTDGCQDKYFEDMYFDWLMYTGYVKVIEDER